MTLTEAERAALKKFVQGGGTVLVDPHAGSPAFAKAMRKELEDLFGPLQPLSADPVLAEGRFEGGVDLSRGVGYTLPARQLIRGRGEKPEGQKLLIAVVKKRPAVIFSEFDLVAIGGRHRQLQGARLQAGVGPENPRQPRHLPDSGLNREKPGRV